MDDQALISALLSKRTDYDAELQWHRFLLDAFAGTGGFEGRVRMPFASFWGAGADMYGRGFVGSMALDIGTSESQVDTYLDRFHREDAPKFARRAAIANYCSPVEKIVDIRLSYLSRKPWQRDGVEKLASWMKDVDGYGTSFDTLMRTVVRVRGEVVGYGPVLVDMARADTEDGEQLSAAQADEQKLSPRLIPLSPSRLFAAMERARGGLA